MVKLKGPSIALEAAGSIGNALTYSTWKGRPYAKKLSIPTNPKSGGQVGGRSMLAFLTQNLDTLNVSELATWEDLAARNNVSPYNAWLSYNLQRWGRFLPPTKAYPAAETNDESEINSADATALKRSIRLHVEIGEALDGWGLHFHRSTSPGFNIAVTNCIRVVRWEDGMDNDLYITDGPLDPATYYYRVQSFSDDGNNPYPYTSEFNATIS